MLELVFQKPDYGKLGKHERDAMTRVQYKEILLEMFRRLAIIKFRFTTKSDHCGRYGFGRCSKEGDRKSNNKFLDGRWMT